VPNVLRQARFLFASVPVMPHLAVDIPPGAETEERYCSECGKRTVWYHAYIGGDLGRGSRGWWQWNCAGLLTAEERAAGK
jgi:hypothetical protein